MRAVVGPTVRDLAAVDFGGARSIVATAFYSRAALNRVPLRSSRIDLAVRLDLNSADEWKRGLIDPQALAAFIDAHEAAGRTVNLCVHPIAHAKVYVGRKQFLIGSANLTTRGFSGVGHEILWIESNTTRHAQIIKAMEEYCRAFSPLSRSSLEAYIRNNLRSVEAFRKTARRAFDRTDEDRVESLSPRASRYGEYEAFRAWLATRPEAAAKEVWLRAAGKGGLSGHIRANFFGLRQWMLFNPDIQRFGVAVQADTYKFSRDSSREALLRSFVEKNASDEPGFSLDIWKSYLPVESGGRARNHGGTIGNINRMLPLVARYLDELNHLLIPEAPLVPSDVP